MSRPNNRATKAVACSQDRWLLLATKRTTPRLEPKKNPTHPELEPTPLKLMDTTRVLVKMAFLGSRTCDVVYTVNARELSISLEDGMFQIDEKQNRKKKRTV